MTRVGFPVCVMLLLLTVVASSLRTLDTVQELKDTGFGRPPPRHGYVLLVWYVQNCVDNNMHALCNPVDGEYGFHYFRNKGHSGPLLPKLDWHDGCSYYTLGNLNSNRYKQAGDLPYEVRRYYNKRNKRSNMDRLLVKYCRNQNLIKEIYASAHYESTDTYLIGPPLISDLQHKETSYSPLPHLWQWIIVHTNNHSNNIM